MRKINNLNLISPNIIFEYLLKLIFWGRKMDRLCGQFEKYNWKTFMVMFHLLSMTFYVRYGV